MSNKKNKEKKIKRGDIYLVDLSPTKGHEQSGKRPVVVIQNNIANMFSNTTIIAPCTTRKIEKPLPTHVKIYRNKNVVSSSTILLEQMRVIDKSRLENYIGKLEGIEFKKIDRAIKESLSLN